MRFEYHGREGAVAIIETDPVKEKERDGIYLRVKVDGSWQTRCLTDLPWGIVKAWIDSKSENALERLRYMEDVTRHLHSLISK